MTQPNHGQRAQHINILKIGPHGAREERDAIVVENPLEIRITDQGENGERRTRNLSITMRTPGDDFDLAAGLLLTEGLIRSRDDLLLGPDGSDPEKEWDSCNIINVNLRPGLSLDLARLERRFCSTASCGVCGKATLEGLDIKPPFPIPPAHPEVATDTVHALGRLLRNEQTVFDQTGGLHASALFDAHGGLLSIREDVGRHNATDKVIGWALLEGRMPLHDCVLMVSGRGGYEIIQKAIMAGIPAVAAVGAPSSLAVSLAEAHGQTLLGFVRNGRFNIYSGRDRII